MCLTCGCRTPISRWRRNIRYEDIAAAAEENGRSVAETIDIVDRTIAKDRSDDRRNTRRPSRGDQGGRA